MGGGEFGSGFASGVVSSLISSVIQARVEGKNFATKYPGAFKAIMIASGGLSGGFSSTIAGGKFVDGFRQGIITSGLNHVVHSVVFQVQVKKMLNDIIKKADLNPNSKPIYTKEFLYMLLEKIEGMKQAHKSAGGKTTIKWGNAEGNTGMYYAADYIELNPKRIFSIYRTVSVMFHELRHAWQYNSGTISRWENDYGLVGASLIKEWDAYNFQMLNGDFDGSVSGWRNYYKEEFNLNMKNTGRKWRL